MAKQLITTLVTDDNGEATYNYTGTGAGETTFIAESGDLESDPLIINDVIERITLTADKNILSYADYDSCTLTADVIRVEEEKTVHTYTDNNYHETPPSYALQLNSNSHVLGSINQAEFHINGKTGAMYARSMGRTFDIGQFNVEKPIFFDSNNSSLYYYDQNDQLVISSNQSLYTTSWALLEGDSFDIIEYPLITFKSNILKSNIVDSNNSYSCSSDDILLDINLSNMGSNITIQKQDNSTIEISKNNTTFTITYNQQSFNTNNSNLTLIRKLGTFGIKKDNGEYLWCGDSNISGISIDSGFIVINEYYYTEAMSNPNTGTNVTYHSQGAGDVTITVECMNLQETYEVEDCLNYDNATKDNTSNYTTKNLNSHTFSTDKYLAERTLGSSANTYYSLIYPSTTLPTDYEISVDMLALTKEQDKQFGLCISNTYTETYTGTNQCFLYANSNRMALGYRVSGSLTNYGESSSYNTNTWYTFKIKVIGTTVTVQILNGDTVVQSWNGTLSNIQSWKKIMLITGGQSNTIYWKNLKIKPL